MPKLPTRYEVRYVLADGRPFTFAVYAFNKLDASALGRLKFEAAVPKAEDRVGVLCYGAEVYR